MALESCLWVGFKRFDMFLHGFMIGFMSVFLVLYGFIWFYDWFYLVL